MITLLIITLLCAAIPLLGMYHLGSFLNAKIKRLKADNDRLMEENQSLRKDNLMLRNCIKAPKFK